MHLGNLYTALISWLSVKARGGKWILRIEDIDPSRSRPQWAELIEHDLLRLGLEWDEKAKQSDRGSIYEKYFARLTETGNTYPCRCTRADIMATQAPHLSDGRVVYNGRCRPEHLGANIRHPHKPESHTHGANIRPDDVSDETVVDNIMAHDGNRVERPAATRLFVPDREIVIDDLISGLHRFNLAKECGDFIIRRADGAWAYQLAVVVDDALMGVTEVVRGNDLLLSAAQQTYLYELTGYRPPAWIHLPLMVNEQGLRLSKRDAAMGAGQLFDRYTPAEVLGIIAHAAGLISSPRATDLSELTENFTLTGLKGRQTIKCTIPDCDPV